MNVALIHDDVAARAGVTADEAGVLEAVDAVDDALAALGHRVARVPLAGNAASWCARLERASADLVFNLCEGVNGASALEPNVAALVELLGVPMTGSPSVTLALARRKDHVSAILTAAGIPAPAWSLIRAGEAADAWESFPAIVKPAAEDASIGITQSSVVRDAYELTQAIAEAQRFGLLLVQEYIAGRELNAGMVGDTTLPIAEIDFAQMPAGAWRIVSYRAKWETGSDEDLGSAPVCPAPLSDAENAIVTETARRAWGVLGGTGYGRIDFRMTSAGIAHVLEINPNPDLAPGAGLARMAARHGWSYQELVAQIVEEALRATVVPAVGQSRTFAAVSA